MDKKYTITIVLFFVKIKHLIRYEGGGGHSPIARIKKMRKSLSLSYYIARSQTLGTHGLQPQEVGLPEHCSMLLNCSMILRCGIATDVSLKIQSSKSCILDKKGSTNQKCLFATIIVTQYHRSVYLLNNFIHLPQFWHHQIAEINDYKDYKSYQNYQNVIGDKENKTAKYL